MSQGDTEFEQGLKARLQAVMAESYDEKTKASEKVVMLEDQVRLLKTGALDQYSGELGRHHSNLPEESSLLQRSRHEAIFWRTEAINWISTAENWKN